MNSSSHGTHIKAQKDRGPGQAARGIETLMTRAPGKRRKEGTVEEQMVGEDMERQDGRRGKAEIGKELGDR